MFHLNFVEVSVCFAQKFRYTAHLTPVQTCTGIKIIIIQRNVKLGLIHRKIHLLYAGNKFTFNFMLLTNHALLQEDTFSSWPTR